MAQIVLFGDDTFLLLKVIKKMYYTIKNGILNLVTEWFMFNNLALNIKNIYC